MNAILTRARRWSGWGAHAVVVLVLISRGFLMGANAAAEADVVSRPPVWVVAVSPYLGTAAKESAFQGVVRFLITQMPTDSDLTVVDGYRLRTVTRMEIPAREAFRSEKTRLNQFSTELREFKRFLATHEVQPRVGGLDFSDAMRIPALLDYLAEHHVRRDRDVRLVFLGSPLHLDEKEPSYSMADGFFPADAHLGVTRERSVYGTQDREGWLARVRVDWGYFGDPWKTELHREKVERFWRLFVAQQGGRLSAVAADLPVVFASTLRVTEDEKVTAPEVREWTAVPGGKLEMIRVSRGAESMDWIRGERVVNAAQGPPRRLRGPLKVGIRWADAVDLDLYARPGAGRERLSFEHPRSPEGYYFKDHRTSPGDEFEFIEFLEPVAIGDLDVWVNLYEGRVDAGARGEVRVEIEGGVYSAPFAVAAISGNEGREGRGQERWWTRIDLLGVLGLGAADQARR